VKGKKKAVLPFLPFLSKEKEQRRREKIKGKGQERPFLFHRKKGGEGKRTGRVRKERRKGKKGTGRISTFILFYYLFKGGRKRKKKR